MKENRITKKKVKVWISIPSAYFPSKTREKSFKAENVQMLTAIKKNEEYNSHSGSTYLCFNYIKVQSAEIMRLNNGVLFRKILTKTAFYSHAVPIQYIELIAITKNDLKKKTVLTKYEKIYMIIKIIF